MARQGLVLKVEKQRMTVMTDDGEFLDLPTPVSPPKPGDTIPIVTSRKAGRNYPKLALVAALLVALVSISIFGPIFSSQSVAAVKFDAPVALELGVDKQNRVVEVKAEDPVAQSLAEELELRGKDIYVATGQVVQATCRKMMLDPSLLPEEAYVVMVVPRRGQRKISLDRQRLHGQMERALHEQQFEGYLVVLDNEEILKENRAMLQRALNAKDEETLERNFPGRWSRVDHHHGRKGKQMGTPEAQGVPPVGGETRPRRQHNCCF